MDLGVTKQLDFEDLIQLPNEMNPSSCYDTLLRCWVEEQSKHFNQPSLFRAICHAYGWPYICLGLLKVLQFCILHDECLLYWCESITWCLAQLFHEKLRPSYAEVTLWLSASSIEKWHPRIEYDFVWSDIHHWIFFLIMPLVVIHSMTIQCWESPTSPK